MANNEHLARELKILESIEGNPDTTQASLATELGVAVGTVNWHVKRLIKKGYIKVTQLQRRRLRYIVTPSGIAERSKLAASYLQNSMLLYRKTRTQARMLLQELRDAGYEHVCIDGDGDLADVVRLTCLEQGVQVVESDTLPCIKIDGTQLRLNC